jgi:tetratricopeptide (TPR) repeat protein
VDFYVLREGQWLHTKDSNCGTVNSITLASHDIFIHINKLSKIKLFIMRYLTFFLFYFISFVSNSQAHSFNGSKLEANDLCNFFRGNSFKTDEKADEAVNKILSVSGLSKRFVLFSCSEIDNCLAVSYKGVRYILYDPLFMSEIADATNEWTKLSILAHEIGHHVNGHSLDLILFATETVYSPTLEESRLMELEADEFSGLILYKLGASLEEAQSAIKLISTSNDDTFSTHPNRDKRLKAIENGYLKGLNNDFASLDAYKNQEKNANDFIVSGDNEMKKANYEVAINNYSRAISLDPNIEFAYMKLAHIYNYKLIDSYKAIEISNRLLKINPNSYDAFLNIGIAYENQKDFKKADQYYSKCIKIDPFDTDGYYWRGCLRSATGFTDLAIEDYTKGLEIDPNDTDILIARAEEYFYEKNDLKSALKDYNLVIELDMYELDAYRDRSEILIIQKKYKEAIEDLNVAISLGVNDKKNLILDLARRADLYYDETLRSGIQSFEKALDDYLRILDLDTGKIINKGKLYGYITACKMKLNEPYCFYFRKACENGICEVLKKSFNTSQCARD